MAVVGTTTYKSPWKVTQYLRSLEANTVIVSGGCPGPARAALNFAKMNRIFSAVEVPLPGRTKRDVAARLLRIVCESDRMVAFWDGDSAGTLVAIKKAIEHGKEVMIIP